RYSYWTILVDGAPTAFRAREREELLPTLHQLQRKNPNVAMQWFARGRLWESREAEQEDFQRKKRAAEAPFAKPAASGAMPTGAPAGRTRIHAIGSRRRTGRSVRGRTRTIARSASVRAGRAIE